ncbi:unnamed protein product, partial [marine sediment metagenome]
MLNIKFIRENLKEVEQNIRKRHLEVPLKHLLEIDDERLKLILEVDSLRHKRKIAADKQDEKEGREIKNKLSKQEAALSAVEAELNEYLEQVPNMLSPHVPDGKNEEDNKETKKWGSLPKFEFKPKDHVTIGKELGLIDQEASAKSSGHGFYYLSGDGALLELALVNWAVSFLDKKGYTPTITPELVRKKFIEGTGYLPRREEPDVYKIEGEDLYLVATSEIPIAAVHSGDILNEADLPKNYAGFSSSFRK